MAGRIFVTGDIHGKPDRFSTSRFTKQKELDKEDYVIICGDFGLVWDAKIMVQADRVLAINTESDREKWWLDWLEKLPFTVLFVDGNHENYDRLNQYAVEEWNGGKVHKIRPSVIHLMRGQVFELAGKRIFTFGGARSHDIEDGILEYTDPQLKEKVKKLNQCGALYRVNHQSWWEEEMPSADEMKEGADNLAQCGNEVDYIISHCCPGILHERINPEMEETNELTLYFDGMKRNCQYKKWYFGHYHEDKNITEQDVLLYKEILELGNSVDENRPILGKPRYAMYQPVKFTFEEKDKTTEKVGLVFQCDPYGSFHSPDEPSYDIMALLGTENCLYKHYSESKVQALTKDEIAEHSILLARIAKCRD